MTSDVKLHEQRMFQQGDVTCYISAKFFPRYTRRDIFKLYFFLQTISECADVKPQRKDTFDRVCSAWHKAKHDETFVTIPSDQDTVEERTIKNMVSLVHDCAVDPAWFDCFLKARAQDFDSKVTYKTLEDTLAYIADTSEVLALMMCKIMHFDPITYPAARLEARAMQYLNFVRDWGFYNDLGRCYIPTDELRSFGLLDPSEKTAAANREAFKACVRKQVDQFGHWQKVAKEDLVYVPQDCKVSVITLIEMYDWTAATICNDPFVIFDHQVKPAKHRVLIAGLSNMLSV